MRGLTKQPPPTNVSPPGQEPRSLSAADAAYQASRLNAADPAGHARSEFDSMHKRQLRDVLFVEQRHLCIFCERTIAEGEPPPPIDHWNPLGQFLLEVFEWNNLHLSCRTVDTCDDRKQSVALNLPWPVNFKYEDVLGFTSGGRMYVRNDAALQPQLRKALELALDDQTGPPVVRSTLNLNQPALRAAREAAIEAEETPVPTPEQRRQRVAALLEQSRRDGFFSARLAALNDQLGVGK